MQFDGMSVHLQAASEASGVTDSQHGSPKPARLTQPPTPSHARTVRAQAAKRLSTELQEVLRHAALAMLHIADADAVIGLERYCQNTFCAVQQLIEVAGDATHSKASSDGITRLMAKDKAEQNQATSSGLSGKQFGWLHGVALQVMHSSCAGFLACCATMNDALQNSCVALSIFLNQSSHTNMLMCCISTSLCCHMAITFVWTTLNVLIL